MQANRLKEAEIKQSSLSFHVEGLDNWHAALWGTCILGSQSRAVWQELHCWWPSCS